MDATATGLTTATSSAFNITTGSVDHLSFSVQPTTAVAAASITPAIKVEFRDAGENLVTSTANVTLSINNNPGTGTLSGTLIQAAVGGVATFARYLHRKNRNRLHFRRSLGRIGQSNQLCLQYYTRGP